MTQKNCSYLRKSQQSYGQKQWQKRKLQRRPDRKWSSDCPCRASLRTIAKMDLKICYLLEKACDLHTQNHPNRSQNTLRQMEITVKSIGPTERRSLHVKKYQMWIWILGNHCLTETINLPKARCSKNTKINDKRMQHLVYPGLLVFSTWINLKIC